MNIYIPVSYTHLLKKSIEENRKIVREADEKIETVSHEIKRGNYPKEGITWISHLVGLFGQRLWFYGKTQNYTDKLMIHESCIGCGLCATLCPMHNISISNGKAMSGKNCTMCYRCLLYTSSINDSYTYNISVNANLLISQFCASQDNYENINLRKLKSLIRKNKDGLRCV